AGWPTLARWTNHMRAEERHRRALEDKADDWIRRGAAKAGLLDAAWLSEAEGWMHSEAAGELGHSAELSRLVAASRTHLASTREVAMQPMTRSPGIVRGVNHLLVIAIDRYIHYPPLANCVRDASDITGILTSAYEFEQELVTS